MAENIIQKRIITPFQRKAISEAATVDQQSRKVSGYLSKFNVIDSDDDIIIPGAFSKSIQEHGPNSSSPRKIAYLWQHDMREPIGRFTELKEDAVGLYFEAEIDDTPRGNQALKQYASGTLNQHSIGFNYVADKMRYDEEKKAYIIGEVRLWEGSVVTAGSNEFTEFLGFKSGDADAVELLQHDTEKTLKQLTPELSHTIRQLCTKWFSLGKVSEPQANPVTPEEKEPETKEKDANWENILKCLTKN